MLYKTGLSEIDSSALRRGLHDLLVAAGSSCCKVPNINILISLEFFQAWEDALLDELLTLGRRGLGFAFLF